MIVSNSSPLIALGKQGSLGLLAQCFSKVIIPKAVHAEITCNNETPEAIALEKAISDGWVYVEIVEVSSVLRTKKLGSGEKEAISLAEKQKTVLLLDDDSAKAYASMLGIEAHGTLYVVYLARLRNFISKEDAVHLLDSMVANGFYVSIEVYSKFLNLLNSIN